MRLILLHADIAARSCSDCKSYLYHDRGPDDFGAVVTRGGKPSPRPKGMKTPCNWCPKIPPGDEPKPENAVELSDKNVAALVHYRECRAVGEFPRDAIVLRNAALIRSAEDVADRVQQARAGASVVAGLKSIL